MNVIYDLITLVSRTLPDDLYTYQFSICCTCYCVAQYHDYGTYSKQYRIIACTIIYSEYFFVLYNVDLIMI